MEFSLHFQSSTIHPPRSTVDLLQQKHPPRLQNRVGVRPCVDRLIRPHAGAPRVTLSFPLACIPRRLRSGRFKIHGSTGKREQGPPTQADRFRSPSQTVSPLELQNSRTNRAYARESVRKSPADCRITGLKIPRAILHRFEGCTSPQFSVAGTRTSVGEARATPSPRRISPGNSRHRKSALENRTSCGTATRACATSLAGRGSLKIKPSGLRRKPYRLRRSINVAPAANSPRDVGSGTSVPEALA